MKKLWPRASCVLMAFFASSFANADSMDRSESMNRPVAVHDVVPSVALSEDGEFILNPCEPLNPCEMSPCTAGLCGPCEPTLDLCSPKNSLWFFGAHAEAGLFVNEFGRKNAYGSGDNGPDAFSGNTRSLQNVHNADLQLNQLYLQFGKKLDKKRGWDYGGEIDLMFGTDARFVQSQGLEFGTDSGRWNSGDYYTALPQLFFEVGYKNWSLKIGKFLNPMGHDSILSLDRFFYSLSDAFSVRPATQSGVLLTWDVSKDFSVFAGWTNGTGMYQADIEQVDSTGLFFASSASNAFLGGFRYDLNDRAYVKYAFLAGKDDRDQIAPLDSRDYFVQSLLFGYKPGKQWDYTFEWTLRGDDGWLAGQNDHCGAYGINNELIYRYNSDWAFGARAEWLHYYGSAFGGEDKYNVTLGANWTPTRWLLVRPELRYDDYDSWNVFSDKGGATHCDQLSGGVSMTLQY